MLIRFRASFEATFDGRTPLYVASWTTHLEVVELLLSHDAKHHPEINGTTPLNITTQKCRLEVMFVCLVVCRVYWKLEPLGSYGSASQIWCQP